MSAKARIQIATVILAAVLYASAVVAGYYVGKSPQRVKTRTVVSHVRSGDTVAEVRAHIGQRPYVQAALSELPGFNCEGFKATGSYPGWVLILCSR